VSVEEAMGVGRGCDCAWRRGRARRQRSRREHAAEAHRAQLGGARLLCLVREAAKVAEVLLRNGQSIQLGAQLGLHHGIVL
jgi:hypothetical protein